MMDITKLNGVSLAYIGDAVMEVYIRNMLLTSGITDTGRLSMGAGQLVCAPMQSKLADLLLPLLTEDEEAAYKLGRNHKSAAKPKRATMAEYNRATGVEAVFGYLYLTEKTDRAEMLFHAIYRDVFEEIVRKL